MEAKRDMMKKVPVREQDPKVRATNFKEVCLGYNMEEAVAESERCLNCKNAKCIAGCPVSINIPAFIQEVKAGNIEEAAKVIALSSALPAVCGRVCPQESQCEGQCVRGIKGEAVSIGKLERFVADWSREHGFVPAAPEKTNGKKVAVKTATNGSDYAKSIADQYGFDIVEFKDSPTMYQDVITGNTVACFEDYPVMAYNIKQGAGMEMPEGTTAAGSSYGFAVQKGQNAELLEMFNKGLADIKANGTYQEIVDKYTK
mgnify:CR=1 FL=1